MKDFYRFDERRQLEEPPKTFPTTEFLKGINYLGVDLFLNSLLFAFQINGFMERKDFLALEILFHIAKFCLLQEIVSHLTTAVKALVSRQRWRMEW